MDEIILSERIDQWRTLCISELSEDTLTECDALHLGGARGTYLYLADDRPLTGGISVLAKLTTYEAALQFVETMVPILRKSTPSLCSLSDHCPA